MLFLKRTSSTSVQVCAQKKKSTIDTTHKGPITTSGDNKSSVHGMTPSLLPTTSFEKSRSKSILKADVQRSMHLSQKECFQEFPTPPRQVNVNKNGTTPGILGDSNIPDRQLSLSTPPTKISVSGVDIQQQPLHHVRWKS